MTDDNHHIHQLTILRHAQSVANEARILQGQFDAPLSKTGIDQSRALAQLWKRENISFDIVVSSPLERARRTTKILSESLDFSFDLSDLLMERNYGIAEGKSFEELQPILQAHSKRSPYEPAFETGESDWDLFIRASTAIQELLRRDPGRYLVVSHGGLINALMHSILGLPPTSSGHRSIIRLDNTGYAITEYNRLVENWVISQVNDTRHLVTRISLTE